jgi:hypothetical protein
MIFRAIDVEMEKGAVTEKRVRGRRGINHKRAEK